jgi:membrane dipeptidase
MTDHAMAPTWVIDGHNDLPWAVREQYGYDLDKVDLGRHVTGLHTDIPRLRQGAVGGQFWSVYVPCSLAGDSAVTATLEQIDFVRRWVGRFPADLVLATTADGIEAAVGSGRIASLIGIEGGHSIGGSLGTLRTMYELGARYMTLTHNENVAWADSATDVPVLGGLADFGRDVVREMNRLGMFVDLSHVSADVMRDALAVTTAPVLFSHSGAQSVTDLNRNVPDDVLERLPANGGVCMVAFVPSFVSQAVADWYRDTLDLVEARGGDRRRFADIDPVMAERRESDPPPVSGVADVADHIEHVRKVAGLDHVGLGGDYDGTAYFPDGLEDVSCYPRLLEELRSRGWSEHELTALAHGNLLRAMRDVEAVAGVGGTSTT